MNEETLVKMKKMRLHGMHTNFCTMLQSNMAEHLTCDELIAQLIQSEWDDRRDRSIERGTKNARFRYKANIEQIDFALSRGIDKNQLHRLAECSFVKQKENLLITGPTGTGKSFLASAIGHQGCLMGLKVLYASCGKLFAQLKMSKADGSSLSELAKIEKQDVLILDDFGLQPFDAVSRSLLMDIIEDRHGKRSTIVTSQLPVAGWHDVLGEQTIADAILDRLIHGAHRIELKGESLRKKSNSNNENI
jgi:DNA replication protein DnaC